MCSQMYAPWLTLCKKLRVVYSHKKHTLYSISRLRSYKPLWKCSKRFIPPQTDGWSVFTRTLVVLNPKLFSSDEKIATKTKTKKSLYKEQTFAPREFHSVSVRTLTERDKQTQAIRDAQKLAQNVFPPWKTNIDVT